MAKCPYCEGEMKKGFVEADSVLMWVEETKKESFISKIINGDWFVLPGVKGFIKKRIEANYCVECRKIIIDIRE